jgi:hypothetical protein
MSENKRVKVVIKDITGDNGGLIWELSRAGVKVGDIVEGRYLPNIKAVEFTNGIEDCVAWVGETCELITDEQNGKK